MNCNYSFEQKQDYLYLTISGDYNKDDFRRFPKIIMDECEKTGAEKVLINALNVSGTNVPAMERFYMGEEIARVIGSKVKIAVAWPEKDINKFAENVAVNRGGNICVLGDLVSAENWLLAVQERKSSTDFQIRP